MRPSAPTTLAPLRVGYATRRKVRLALDVFNPSNRQVSDIGYFYVSRLRGEPLAGVEEIHFFLAELRTLRKARF